LCWSRAWVIRTITAEPIERPFERGGADSRWLVLDGAWSTCGRRLANTIERSVLGSDASCRYHYVGLARCYLRWTVALGTLQFLPERAILAS